MNRNITATILIIIAIAVYVTLTRAKIDELYAVSADNAEYKTAIDNSDRLTALRDKLLDQKKAISAMDSEKLEKMVPSTVDNIRLIIDLNNLARQNGVTLKNVKANANTSSDKSAAIASTIKTNANSGASVLPEDQIATPTLDTVSISFGVTASYQQFIEFMKALESNLRIMDLTKLTVTANDSGAYDFGVELRTYWLRQK